MMTTSTVQKTNLNNCTYEELFKALVQIEAKMATTSVTDKDKPAYRFKHIVAMSEHYVPLATDNISTTRLGNPQFCDWLPSDFGANKIYWEKVGVTVTRYTGRRKELQGASYLLQVIGTYLNHHTGQQSSVLQTMTGTPFNVLASRFPIIYQNFICYPPALHMETQSKINEIIGEEIEKDLRTGRKKVDMMYAIELLQHIEVILQN